ncbi:hypothetical protein [Desulfoluna spongiiphila]|uniref:hypothetical protein n=1 Tax=Desulfoluna spongiiphila TaxID=419481 RepID=UPI001258AAE0|nr:hypothetical protein [Desulfoluna spongiiphila]VVS93750.1 hypothetical protein DBB_33220 [Desulfoluna spongiiphila]
MQPEHHDPAALIPLLIFISPIVILNIVIAKRKGRSPVLFGLFSLIPFVGFYLSIHLASLMDQSTNDKIDQILHLLEARR